MFFFPYFFWLFIWRFLVAKWAIDCTCFYICHSAPVKMLCWKKKKKKRRRLFCLKFSNNQLSLNNLLDFYCIYFFHCFCICSSQREYCTSMIWSLAFRKTDVDIFIFFIITNSFYLLQYIWCSGSTIVGIGSPDPPQFVYDDEEYHDVFLSGEPRKRIRHSWTVVLKMFL